MSSERSIAILGMGCRFPGGISSPRDFWQLLCSGGDAIREVPAERWNSEALFAPDPSAPGRTYARRGGFLDEIDQFDPEFFGISPREAAHVDPQQRLLLETAHEAMDDAGEHWEDPRLRETGVFVGVFIHDYQHMQFADRELLGAHTGTGTAMSIAANRVSYAFDLRGPSIAVDTACSSSLVAVDLACKALLNGDCDFALAGGVNVILKPEMTIAMSKATMLSRDGSCKSFDARADGYVRGEGAGLVLLARAGDVRPRHRAYAIIRGSGVNSDGKTPGISVPSALAQEALTRRVLNEAGVAPASVAYVEAHGTGTPVGDPIEAGALGRAFAEGRNAEDPLLVGSVKTNIGHLESASGVAGLIKTALCLQHGQIPPNLHFETGNPAIDFAALKLRVVAEPTPWPEANTPRRAAVNSFGFGGTNAHVLLEQPPPVRDASHAASAGPSTLGEQLIVPITAHNEPALRALAASYAAVLSSGADARDLQYTASQRRSFWPCRVSIVAGNGAELEQRLRAFADGSSDRSPTRAEASAVRPVFVFSGMGTQWWGMARELLQAQPIFRAEVQRVDAALARLAPFSILEELLRDEAASRIQETHLAQPAIFAVQAGLTALWKHWGVEPAAIIGHSVGEIGALYAAGVLSLEAATLVVFHRSRLQRTTAGSGSMLAVGLDLADASAIVAELGGAVSVAAVNGPGAITLAGDADALRSVQARLEGAGTFARPLRVEVPYHSAKMEPIREPLLRALSELRPARPHTAYYSSTDGDARIGELGDAAYWWRNVRQTVEFAAAVGAAVDAGHVCFLEVGPHPVLQSAVSDCLRARQVAGRVVGSLRRGASDFESLARSIGDLFESGAAIAWSNVGDGQMLELPTYPWQRSRHWSESAAAEQFRKGGGQGVMAHGRPARYRLLGSKLELAAPTWRQTLRLGAEAYVKDHCVRGSVVFPGTGYLEMALSTLAEDSSDCSTQPSPDETWLLSDVEIGRALYLAEGDKVELETVRNGERWAVHGSMGDGAWVRHASGRVRREQGGVPARVLDMADVKARCSKPLPADYAYRLFRDVGLEYGPAFRAIQELHYGPQEALARLELPAELHEPAGSGARCLFHPALFDACLHTLFGALNLNGEDSDRRGNVFLPVSVERLRLYRRPGESLWSHARLRTRAPQNFSADVYVYDSDGELVAEVVGLRCQALEQSAAIAEKRQREWLLEYAWQAAPRTAPSVKPSGRWLVLAPHVDHPLLALLRTRGMECVVVEAEARAELPSVLKQVLADGATLSGVVHAWCLQDVGTESGAGWAEQELGALSVLQLVQALAPLEAAGTAPPLWLLTRQSEAVVSGEPVRPTHSTVWGLRRVIANEHAGLRARCVDLDGTPAALTACIEELGQDTAEDELAFRGGQRFVHRLRRYQPAAAEAPAIEAPVGQARAELCLKKAGDLRSIAWTTLPPLELGPDEVELQTEAAGLNFKDVMKATGLLPQRLLDGNLWSKETIGMECAGRVLRVGSRVRNLRPGQEVMALAPRSFATHVVTHAALVAPNPGLSAESAAAIPVAFLTACVALEVEARLAPGERVLIHAASGGVGLAALQVARSIGAEVYATAGSEEKRALLRSLGVEHVFDSRSLSFAEDIRRVTGGEGVDVVLNSLSGEAITHGFGLLRDYGRFVEIGKMDLDRDFQLGLRPFARCLAFHAVDLDRMLAQRVELCGKLLTSIHDRLQSGTFQALPVRSFPAEQTAEAFQAMAGARHTGKLVVSIGRQLEARGQSGLRFRSDASYLVTGGLGGFGLQLALWLADHGAGNLILLGRRGRETPGAAAAESSLRARGANVTIEACDVADAGALQRVLQGIPSTSPLRGIFHAAAVLDDALLVNLDAERYRKTFAAKAVGAWNLHTQTRATALDHFMCFSSMASVLGNQGSGNYCAANAFVDGLAHHRRGLGLSALTVNWGVIADVGMAADEDFYRHNLERNGLFTIHSRHCLELLELLMLLDRTQTTVCPIDFETWLRFNPAGRDGRLSELLAAQRVAGAAERARGAEERALREKLTSLDANAAFEAALAPISNVLAQVLRTSVDKIEPTRSLSALGADSLMAIEIKNRLEGLGLDISVSQLLNRNSASTLARLLLDALGHGTDHAEPRAPALEVETGRWLVRRRPRPDARLRLICFPYAGGGPGVYHRWPEDLPESVEVLAVCLPGRGPRVDEVNTTSIAEAAEALLPELLPLLDRPFSLFGHCMGAILMYEVAQRLEALHGKVAARIFVSGCMAPHLYNSPLVHEQDDAAFLDVLRLISFSGTRALVEDEALRDSMFPLLRGDFQAVVEYGTSFAPRPALSAPITGVAAENDLFAAPKAMHAWRRYTTSGYELLRLPGDHYFVESDREIVTHIVRSRLGLEDQAPAARAELRRVESVALQPEPAPLAVSPRRGNRLASEPPEGRTLLVCFPGAGILASELPSLPDVEQEFSCERLEWRDSMVGSLAATVPGAVERALRLLRPFAERRMVFYGHCLGAIVAYELAARLAREGLAGPMHLITAGAVGPHLYVAPDAHRLPTPKLLELLRVLKFPHCERLERDPAFQAERLAMLRRDFDAMASYEHQPTEALDIPITAVSLRHDLWSYPLRTSSWQLHTKLHCEVIERPGDHFVPLREPAILSEILRSLGSSSVAAE